MFDEKEKLEIVDYLIDMPTESSVYFGCDSIKFKKKGEWFAKYSVALVIHIGSKHGAKVFHYTEVERMYDKDPKKVRMRLIQEVYKVTEAYLEFADILEDVPVEIHVDVNVNKEHRSQVIHKEALGYILGMTSITPKFKPEAFCASFAGDRGCRGLLN